MIHPRLKLAALYCYPVKSLAGIEADQWAVGLRGLRYDRHWMLVDGGGNFLSQRRLPRMALIHTRLDASGLTLFIAEGDNIHIPLDAESAGRMEVTIWRDSFSADRLAGAFDRWLSDFLDHECHLVRFPGQHVRQVDPDYGQAGDQTGFSDGFPFLILGSASLQRLNHHLMSPVTPQRFRPNLVIATDKPHCEDEWRRIKIGDIHFRLAKPCSRCAIVNVDPETGVAQSKGPLQALSRYRKRDQRVYFGQNALHDSQGMLRVGDPVLVLE